MTDAAIVARTARTGTTARSLERAATRSRNGAGRPPRQVPAVTRAVAILRLLGGSDDALGVNAIARTLGLIPSTCLHILRVLAAEELVAFDPETKRYRLGAGLVTIARTALHRNGFAELAQPELDRLSRRHGVTAIGVQVVGLDHIVVVAISRSDHAVRLHVDMGSRFPALISASGRCIAAFGGHPWSTIERRFRALRWDRPPSLAAWRAEVEATRANGYAVDEGNYIRGVTVIAAPVRGVGGAAARAEPRPSSAARRAGHRDVRAEPRPSSAATPARDRVGHVVVVVGVSEQVQNIGVDRLARELRTLADGLSRRLGSH